MKVTYKCNNCGTIFSLSYKSNPIYNTKCINCGQRATRYFAKVPIMKEDESVSGALQMMLYSKKPSQAN